MAFVWTDDPITTATKTLIKAVHINEVHANVDTDRVAVALPKYGWTNTTVNKRDLVIAKDFAEAATALTEAWTANCPTHNSSANNPHYVTHQAAVNTTNYTPHMDNPHFSNHKASNFSSDYATPHLSVDNAIAYSSEP